MRLAILASVPGIGHYTAVTIAAEIDGAQRFDDSRKLAAYAGLVPSVRSSAETVIHGRITKRGSVMMRWLLVEAAHTHARYAEDSPITDFYKRLSRKRGTSKAAVAAAAKLLRIIYWMLIKRLNFRECLAARNPEFEKNEKRRVTKRRKK